MVIVNLKYGVHYWSQLNFILIMKDGGGDEK